mgnify:CR=1 FL=1
MVWFMRNLNVLKEMTHKIFVHLVGGRKILVPYPIFCYFPGFIEQVIFLRTGCKEFSLRFG